MIKLFDYFRSSASFRVRIALNLKGISYEQIPIHLVNNGGEQHSAAYHAINPQGLVPSLQANEKIMTQSMAIIEYLDEAYPDPALLPKDLYQKAFARSIALQIAADIHPLNNLRVLKFLTNDMGVDDEKKNQWYQHWLHAGFAALEKELQIAGHSGDYCIGNSPTLADIFLVPQLYNARRFSCDLSAYPRLTAIDAHCQKHPAFLKARPQDN